MHDMKIAGKFVYKEHVTFCIYGCLLQGYRKSLNFSAQDQILILIVKKNMVNS